MVTKKAAPKKPTAQQLAARYGYAISFFNSNPELKKLLANATKNNWDVSNFQAAIRNTKWWKARSDSQRQYDITASTDPAEHKRKIAEQTSAISQQAQAMGTSFSGPAMAKFAAQAVRDGWTPQETQAHLAAQWYSQYTAQQQTPADEAVTGSAASTIASVKAMSSAYGYPLGDDTLAKQTLSILNGTQDPKAIEDTYRQWAKKHFAGVADLIDSGQTVQDILDPYAQIASQELGVGKDTINAADPKWQKALNSGGQALSLSDWRTLIRTDSQYGWDTSETAQSQAYQLTAGLTSMFQGG